MLGAGRIVPISLLKPARNNPNVVVAAVASRNQSNAETLASHYDIDEVYPTYGALLDCADIDAVYVALPVALHHEWSLKALHAGLHVMCEKPLAANGDQAQELAAVARATQRILYHAIPWRHHPLGERVVDLLRRGDIGELREVHAAFAVPIPDLSDIRYDPTLGGGSALDVGIYPIDWSRSITGLEPTITRASATLAPTGVDVRMVADVIFSANVHGTITSSMESDSPTYPRGAVVHVVGSRGSILIENLVAPHLGNQVYVRQRFAAWRFSVEGPSTFQTQLNAFANLAQGSNTGSTGVSDAIASLAVVDAMYASAGLERPGSARSGRQ